MEKEIYINAALYMVLKDGETKQDVENRIIDILMSNGFSGFQFWESVVRYENGDTIK